MDILINLLQPLHFCEDWSQENHRANEARYRIAGQAKNRNTIDFAKHKRFPRAHRNSPEIDIHTAIAQDILNEVVISDRCTAGRD